jgi:hypothetical protein
VNASVRLDEAHDHIRAAARTPVSFVEHRVGLADAGRCTEVDA